MSNTGDCDKNIKCVLHKSYYHNLMYFSIISSNNLAVMIMFYWCKVYLLISEDYSMYQVSSVSMNGVCHDPSTIFSMVLSNSAFTIWVLLICRIPGTFSLAITWWRSGTGLLSGSSKPRKSFSLADTIFVICS